MVSLFQKIYLRVSGANFFAICHIAFRPKIWGKGKERTSNKCLF